MVLFVGRGDARRSMSLLWRGERPAEDTRTGPGPRPGLSVDLIVDTAIAVADAEGMAALSMRAVGERLGRTAMALYTYVANKGELVELMHDRALAELGGEYDLGAGWRPAATAWAEDLWACYLRHPWLLQVSQARPVLGPNEFAMLDAVARILAETGLGPGAVRGMVAALSHLVRGAAQTIAESRQADAETGVGDDDWWAARSALLRELAPDFAERYPNAIWLESEPATPPDDDDAAPYLERAARRVFRAELDLVLDGIEAAVTRSRR